METPSRSIECTWRTTPLTDWLGERDTSNMYARVAYCRQHYRQCVLLITTSTTQTSREEGREGGVRWTGGREGEVDGVTLLIQAFLVHQSSFPIRMPLKHQGTTRLYKPHLDVPKRSSTDVATLCFGRSECVLAFIELTTPFPLS